MWCLWAAKGGGGCSVVAASAALLLARRDRVLLVDLAGGDLIRILGVDAPEFGLADWLRHRNPPPDALARLELSVAEQLSLLPLGAGGPGPGFSPGTDTDGVDHEERLLLLAHLLAADDRIVIVDLGLQPDRTRPSVGGVLPSFLGLCERSTLVTRLCYLALSAAMEQPVPDDVIIVAEPDRALRPADVEAALRAPVSSIRWDPAVARAVDAGLLTRRLPRPLRRLPVGITGSRSTDGTADDVGAGAVAGQSS